MENRPQPSLIERRLPRFVCNLWFLAAFFLAGLVAVIVGWYIRPGMAIVALPLLAWSPFLILIGLNEAVPAFLRIRRSGGSILAAAYSLTGWCGLGAYLFYFGVCLLRGLQPTQWTLWLLVFIVSFAGGYSAPSQDGGRGVVARGKRRRLYGRVARK